MSNDTQVKQEAPERIWVSSLVVLSDDLANWHAHLSTKSLGDEDLEYVRADLLATVRREEREAALEQACLTVCARCRLSEQFTSAERVGDGRRWFHRAANTSFEDGIASQCDAWPIRNLMIEASANQKGEVNG